MVIACNWRLRWDSGEEDDEGSDRLKKIKFYQRAAPSYKVRRATQRDLVPQPWAR